MYKVILALALAFAVTSSYLVVVTVLKDDPLVIEKTITPDIPSSAFEDLKKPLYVKPIELSIDGGFSNIKIESVGLDSTGQLMVPSEWLDAGWYDGSSKPGELGNVIIDGHYDTNTGNPGAFWELKKLKVDDTVMLADELGRTFSYKVYEIIYVDVNDPDRVSVLADTDDATLTLITCGGVWDPITQNYDKRLIVKGSLVSSSMLVSSLNIVH